VSKIEEKFSLELFKLLVKLYDVKEGSMRDIAKKINVHTAQLIKFKKWLITKKVLIFQGIYNVTRNIKGGTRSFEVEYYEVNHKAIDSLVFNGWRETRVLFERAHEYIVRSDLEKY